MNEGARSRERCEIRHELLHQTREALTFIDVRELLDSQAQKGGRLEFKNDLVGQDEQLKTSVVVREHSRGRDR